MSDPTEDTPVNPASLSPEAKALDQAQKVTAKIEDNNLLVNTYQDVEPHIEYAAKLRRADAEERGAFGKRKDLHHTMSVPHNVIIAVAKQLGIEPGQMFDPEHSKRIYAELKRPEFKVFRATNDKLI